MARQKEFDREVVLAKAMETFWQYGYEGTSIQDLLNSMGINRGSLYDTFGDKRSLFLEAIAHYEATIVQQILKTLAAPNASKQAIIDYFNQVVDRIISDKQRRGCLLTNTAVELCAHDPDTAQRVTDDLKRVEGAFYMALSRAKTLGELSLDADIQAIASFLTFSLQGLRVMSRVNPSRETLQAVVRVILSVLESKSQINT